jgi:acyl dehydratase
MCLTQTHTADPQWIHTSEAKALGSPFGGPIAHGFLTLSLLPYLFSKVKPTISGAKMGVNYGLNKVRFMSPVPVGSQIRAIATLQEVQEIEQKGQQSKGIQNIYNITVEVEGSKKSALNAETIIRVYF